MEGGRSMPRRAAGPQLRANPKRGGTFYIYWTDERTGRSRERSTGTRDQGQAAEYFARWLGQPRSVPQGWTGPRRAADAPIIEVLAMYAQEHVAEHVVSKETAAYNIATLAKWWGGQNCDAIKPETCRAYVRERGASPSSAARELTTLNAALGYAHKNGKLIDRPFVELPPRPPGRDRWLTRSEAARLLWESRRDPQARGHLPLFILLALTTGARPAALFDLRWTQIDFDRDRIDFNPPGRQRTSKGRPIIPMPRRLRWFLLRAHARAASPYVLSFRGAKLASVKKAFRAARKRAGLGADVIPYTLRHSCFTWMAQKQVPMWQISGWAGHTLQRTTELYSHHSPEHLSDARRVMD